MSLLCDLLKNIVDLLCDDVVDLTAGVSGPVTQAVWTDLDPATQSAIDKIDQIHGSSTPSYTPSDAGDENATVDTTGWTTEKMGGDACERATKAWKDAGCDGGSSDHEASSTSLYKTRDVLVKLRAQADPT
ncbi:MAG: hypothetical protein V3T53_05810 [Phycisphaerales bacterium]